MKAFKNALVYVEGEGIKRYNLIFDGKIQSIGGNAESANVISIPENATVFP